MQLEQRPDDVAALGGRDVEAAVASEHRPSGVAATPAADALLLGFPKRKARRSRASADQPVDVRADLG
jgi:hypothetical protein